jgi:hypothetical protein
LGLALVVWATCNAVVYGVGHGLGFPSCATVPALLCCAALTAALLALGLLVGRFAVSVALSLVLAALLGLALVAPQGFFGAGTGEGGLGRLRWCQSQDALHARMRDPLAGRVVAAERRGDVREGDTCRIRVVRIAHDSTSDDICSCYQDCRVEIRCGAALVFSGLTDCEIVEAPTPVWTLGAEGREPALSLRSGKARVWSAGVEGRLPWRIEIALTPP